VSDVQIPKMGMSTVEVDIVRVLVAPGQKVAAHDVVVEIESEKANYEITAGKEGTVAEVLVEEGDVRNVGDVVIRLDP
jgi:pyruvate/2-oxoglutarate dehydrogenase complex dihydrolipoamide acyltransferase (E2) component